MQEWLTNLDLDFKKIPYINKSEYTKINDLFENILKNEKSMLFNNQTMYDVLIYKETENKESLENIKNWLRYRIVNLLLNCDKREYFYIFDCESSNEAHELYDLLSWDNQNAHDNINSFQTIWTTIIRKFAKDMTYIDYKNVQKEYEFLAEKLLRDNKSSTKNKLNLITQLGTKLWQLNNLENFAIPKNILEELCKLAYNTHTIGNFMPCPQGYYNNIKGSKTNCCDDRIDLILSKLKNLPNEVCCYDYQKHINKKLTNEDVENILNWFDKNKIDNYSLEDYLSYEEELIIKPINNSLKRISTANSKEEIYSYLKRVNELIEIRRNKIDNKLHKN